MRIFKDRWLTKFICNKIILRPLVPNLRIIEDLSLGCQDQNRRIILIGVIIIIRVGRIVLLMSHLQIRNIVIFHQGIWILIMVLVDLRVQHLEHKNVRNKGMDERLDYGINIQIFGL